MHGCNHDGNSRRPSPHCKVLFNVVSLYMPRFSILITGCFCSHEAKFKDIRKYKKKTGKGEGKAMPAHALTGPGGSSRMRF